MSRVSGSKTVAAADCAHSIAPEDKPALISRSGPAELDHGRTTYPNQADTIYRRRRRPGRHQTKPNYQASSHSGPHKPLSAAALTVMEIPVRMAQTRTRAAKWESQIGNFR